MIVNAIARAYKVMAERNWDTIYWAIDLHGVCLKSNYESGGYEWINEWVPKTLQLISSKPETKIILWSSVYGTEMQYIEEFFEQHGIIISDFNKNEREPNTHVSCFDKKFYFSVLLDDKAGFDPETHWLDIYEYFNDADCFALETKEVQDFLVTIYRYKHTDSPYEYVIEDKLTGEVYRDKSSSRHAVDAYDQALYHIDFLVKDRQKKNNICADSF